MIKGKKMSIYELRIYTLYVGKINEAKEIYQNHGWPAIKKYEEYGRKQTSLPSPESKQKPAEIIKYIFLTK